MMPVAAGEVLGAGHETRWLLADQAAAFADLGLQPLVLRRVDHIDTPGHHGNGAGGKCCLVRGRVDAAGQTGGDGEAGAADARCEQAGELLACRRPVARPDDGQRRPQQLAEVAFGIEAAATGAAPPAPADSRARW